MKDYFERYLEALSYWQSAELAFKGGHLHLFEFEKFTAKLQNALNDYIDSRIEKARVEKKSKLLTMTQPTRPEGYYWVQEKELPQKWMIAEWFNDGWYLHGVEFSLGDADFISIGHRIPSNEELEKMIETLQDASEEAEGRYNYDKSNSEWYPEDNAYLIPIKPMWIDKAKELLKVLVLTVFICFFFGCDSTHSETPKKHYTKIIHLFRTTNPLLYIGGLQYNLPISHNPCYPDTAIIYQCDDGIVNLNIVNHSCKIPQP